MRVRVIYVMLRKWQWENIRRSRLTSSRQRQKKPQYFLSVCRRSLNEENLPIPEDLS